MSELDSTNIIGQTAYQAYSQEAGGKSLVSGVDLPAWDDLATSIQRAWEAAGLAVLDQANRSAGEVGHGVAVTAVPWYPGSSIRSIRVQCECGWAKTYHEVTTFGMVASDVIGHRAQAEPYRLVAPGIVGLVLAGELDLAAMIDASPQTAELAHQAEAPEPGGGCADYRHEDRELFGPSPTELAGEGSPPS